MLSTRKNEIRNKAKEINDLSENFQMIHATYATQEYIKSIVKEFYQKKLDVIKSRISEKIQKDCDITQELKEKDQLEAVIKRNRAIINVDYIDITDEKVARVVKVDNAFTIYLASSLRDSIFTESHEYNYTTIQKIRELMAHELGHLNLHTKELLSEDGTQGTLTIKDDEKETEANFFGEQLLNLRKERNKKIRHDGGAEKLF